MADMIDLKGRVAIVTGGSQGLGFEMALGLAQAGGRVTIASIDPDKLETARSMIGPERCHTVVADISKEEDCQRIFQETLDRFGGLAVLINNARAYGDTPHKPLWETDPEYWRYSVNVNVYGTFIMTYTVLKHLMKQGLGRIINITTSIDTMQRVPMGCYGVTKAAIEMETITWAKELAGTGITVNSLIPGGASDRRGGRKSPPTVRKTLTPFDAMAAPACWLASDLSSGYTGGRYVARLWDKSLAPTEAAERAREPSVFRPPSEHS